MRKQDYPPDWPQISLAVRERAGQKCEWCGAPNGEWILRDKKTELFQTVWIGEQIRDVPFNDFQICFPKELGHVHKKNGAVKNQQYEKAAGSLAGTGGLSGVFSGFI